MTTLSLNLLIALTALLFERIAGYPNGLYRLIRHPVVWMGAFLSLWERSCNQPNFSDMTRRVLGVATLLLLIAVTLVATGFLSFFLRCFTGGLWIEAVLASSLLAQKSLFTHVDNVAKALANNLPAGRQAVSMIVGRDPADLDESGIAKAAVESLAENTADGIIAPLFYLVLFGLPGAAIYKAVNTADSMIGHKSDRYRAFGWAAARLDDVLNYPCARLTGGLFALSAGLNRRWNGCRALVAMHRDALHHVSPNAGWPEAALAGALGLALGGRRSYQGRVVDLATMGSGRAELSRHDIDEALLLYQWCLTLTALLIFCLLLLCVTLAL